MIKHCVLYSGGFMKRRIFCFILFLFVFISLLFVKSFKKEEIDYSVSPVKKNNNTLSMMLENDDGVYEYTTSDSWPQKGYSFNAELSKCENGGELSWDDVSKKIYMSGNVSDKCYVYFDKMPLGKICEGQNMATCFKENYTFDNALYHHDKSLENSAEDNSYRYSGGDFIITQKAIDAGFTELGDLDITSEHNEGLIKFYCDGQKSRLGTLCKSEYYYLLGNDTDNKYITNYRDVTNKAIELGYLKKDNVKNYVCFGSDMTDCPEDNLYRIIGIFDGNVKLIKAYSASRSLLGEDGGFYGCYDWSNDFHSFYYGSNVFDNEFTNCSSYYWNNATGTNIWSESNLNTINLNTNFLNNFSQEWRDKIETINWNIGSNSFDNLVSTPQNTYKNDVQTSSAKYKAKIGLLSISEYFYGVSPVLWQSNFNGKWDFNMWIKVGTSEQLITTISDTNNSLSLYMGFPVDWFTVNKNVTQVRPAFYLKSTINLLHGLGTIDEPYRIS